MSNEYEELLQPATEIEVAELLELVKLGGKECAKHALTVRRLAYERRSLRDELDEAKNELEDVLSQLG